MLIAQDNQWYCWVLYYLCCLADLMEYTCVQINEIIVNTLQMHDYDDDDDDDDDDDNNNNNNNNNNT